MEKVIGYINKEIDSASKKILNWFKGEKRCLTIKSSPFNTPKLFKNLINYSNEVGFKILYIYSRGNNIKPLLDELKKKSGIGRITNGVGNHSINFVHYEDIFNVSGKYNLIVIDDVSDVTRLTESEILDIYDYCKQLSNKIIIYTISEGDPSGEEVEFPYINNKPFCEPRVITTRIDLDKDIPYLLYDYIKFFQNEKRNVIIYVPNKKNIESVYDYYLNKLKLSGIKIKKLYKDEGGTLNNVLKVKEKATFIITDNKEVSLEGTNIGDAIILFGDSYEYTFRKLMFISGQLTKNTKKQSELLVVVRDETEVIDKVRETSREYNKILWEINSKK